MPRSMPIAMLGVLLAACPSETDPPVGTTGTSTAEATSSPGDTGTDSPGNTSATSEGDVAWWEVGWGVAEFNAYDGILPIVIGPQGLDMFSMPIRGAGFYTPPDPSFDNPDMPMLQAWVDVPGYSLTPDGHFNEVLDYPALFYPSLDEPGVLEGPAVWLVLPDSVTPDEIAGLDAHLHAELLDAEGVLLTADHDLVIGEPPEPPPGP